MDDPAIPPPSQDSEPPGPPRSDDALSRTLLMIGLALVVGAIAVYYFSGDFQTTGRPAAGSAGPSDSPVIPIPVPEIRGKPAPAFELPDVNGKIVKLADFKGKILLVNFWATWCNPCLTEIPWFIEFKERYGSRGFDVIAVNIHETDKTAVMPFIVKYNMQPLNVVIAPPETDAEFGGFPGLPMSFLVDREGKFFSKHIGLVSKEDVEDEILMLLESSPSAGDASAPSTDAPSAAPAPQG
jgi:thiol-disulfide isomerase/thioredoxin